jgi:hypothetical protein
MQASGFYCFVRWLHFHPAGAGPDLKDTFGGHGFGLLATSKQPEPAALLLHNEVLPCYVERGLEQGVDHLEAGSLVGRLAHIIHAIPNAIDWPAAHWQIDRLKKPYNNPMLNLELGSMNHDPPPDRVPHPARGIQCIGMRNPTRCFD